MTQVICRLGLVVFMALIGLTGWTTTVAAEPSSTPERFELSAVKAARPFLVDTLTAIQQGNVVRAKEAFESYDFGVERHRGLHQYPEQSFVPDPGA